MNKTIFNLNYKTSIIIVSILGIILGFLSNAFYINGVLGYIFYLFRLIVFVGIYGIMNFLEKNNEEFRIATKRMIGYLSVGGILNIIFALFATTHILRELFLTLSGVVCFWVILAFVVEILIVYIKENKVINRILKIDEKIGAITSQAIVKLFKSKND